MGDYNYEPVNLYNLVNIVKESTCFKNTENPRCIDCIIMNRKKEFQNTMIIETGLSYFHKMTIVTASSIFNHFCSSFHKSCLIEKY